MPRRLGAVPDSVFERLVEQIVISEGIPAPTRQHAIALAGGARRVDLAWPNERVAVEAHSKRWHFGNAVEEDDNHRDLELAAAGWEVLYVTWKMAQQPAFFVDQLSQVLERRSRTAA